MENRFSKYIYEIFGTDSPSGYNRIIGQKLIDILTKLGYAPERTNKGNIVVYIPGKNTSKTVATSAHVDTLGLMVRSIKSNGHLKITNVGGPIAPTLDGEYVKIVTRSGKIYTGTVLSESPSAHVYNDASTSSRNFDNMVIRLDEKVKSKEDVEKLGINNGDYILIDPKTVITESGFLKSRFIDDKGSVCVLLAILEEIAKSKITLANNTYFYFVNHEEVGHGASTIDKSISEFVTVDMGCIGKDLAGNEYAVSIAAKDSMGPYDYELTSRLIDLAKDNKVDYVVDIFPYYGSDVGAAWRAGVDCAGALIGPGVDASHGMERTHIDALEQAYKLMLLYLEK